MDRAILGGVAYFALMFAIGFVLGTARVLLIAPQVGEWGAAAIELPIMLAISWFVCAWLIRRLAVPARVGARIAMGVVAFALLMVAEVMLGITLFARTLEAQIAAMIVGPGLAGLAGQLAFAAFPLVQLRRP